MKAFYVMFVVFAVLLFAAPMTSAQDGSPSCSGGSAYDLTGHGCVTGYTNGSAAASSIAPKVAGLAAPAQAAQQNQGWPGCPWGAAYDPMAQGYMPACFSRPADNAASRKPVGLAKLTPVEVFVPCGAGENLDPLLDPQALACLMTQSVPAAKAASKPAGLAAPAMDAEQSLACPWGANLALGGPYYVPDCSGSYNAPAAASKPAGLAKPAAAVIPEQGWPGCPWGDTYDPMAQGYMPACFSRPADNAASLKPAGLAKLAPVEVFAPCGAGENLDPLLDPQALACLTQSVVPAAKAASKPAGLAAPAPAQEQFGPCDAGELLDPLLDPLALACLH